MLLFFFRSKITFDTDVGSALNYKSSFKYMSGTSPKPFNS